MKYLQLVIYIIHFKLFSILTKYISTAKTRETKKSLLTTTPKTTRRAKTTTKTTTANSDVKYEYYDNEDEYEGMTISFFIYAFIILFFNV